MKAYNYITTGLIVLLLITLFWVICSLDKTMGVPQTDGQSGIGIMFLIYIRLALLFFTLILMLAQLIVVIRKRGFQDRHLNFNSLLLISLLIVYFIYA